MHMLMERFVALVAFVCAWCAAHPEIAWPLLTAAVTTILKPRTPEQYAAIAKKWPRVAAFLQLVGALGLDPVKAAKVVGKVLTGKSEPPPPPKGPSVVGVVLLAATIAVGTSACTPQARWAVADLLASKIACAVAHQDLTTEQIVVQCAIEPNDVDRIMAIVGESRKASAKAALEASARAGMCPGDAGAEGGAR